MMSAFAVIPVDSNGLTVVSIVTVDDGCKLLSGVMVISHSPDSPATSRPPAIQVMPKFAPVLGVVADNVEPVRFSEKLVHSHGPASLLTSIVSLPAVPTFVISSASGSILLAPMVHGNFAASRPPSDMDKVNVPSVALVKSVSVTLVAPKRICRLLPATSGAKAAVGGPERLATVEVDQLYWVSLGSDETEIVPDWVWFLNVR